MNIDFIKWTVGYAEGFELKIEQGTPHIKCPNLVYYGINLFNNYDLNVESIYYPLLLQRAIEGINIKTDYDMTQFKEGILVKNPNGELYQHSYTGTPIDIAKEQGLKYIWENESK